MNRRLSATAAAVVRRMVPVEYRDAFDAAHAQPEGARVAGGHLAQDVGTAWERHLAAQHRTAYLAGLAVVKHVGPPHRRIGPREGDIRLVGNGPADYQGAIRAPGWWRPLAVEAKSYEGRLQRDHVKPHQREDLERVAKIGGVALVAIELHTTQGESLGMWALPWAVLETLWSRKEIKRKGKTHQTASVGPDELVGWEMADLYLERFEGRG